VLHKYVRKNGAFEKVESALTQLIDTGRRAPRRPPDAVEEDDVDEEAELTRLRA